MVIEYPMADGTVVRCNVYVPGYGADTVLSAVPAVPVSLTKRPPLCGQCGGYGYLDASQWGEPRGVMHPCYRCSTTGSDESETWNWGIGTDYAGTVELRQDYDNTSLPLVAWNAWHGNWDAYSDYEYDS